ncbi:restriction endonuclease subunit S [Nonlabens sp.]|uniref:restriction endonuclease subunit S n=1 Tax=Nonlabens sp. TaxID=1888209 RepID=UPI00321AAC43
MTQVRGLSYSKKDSTDVYDEGKIAVLRAGNIYESQIIEKDYVFVPRTLVKEKQYLKHGDILIAASSGSISVVGKAAMVSNNMDASFGAFCKVLRPDKAKVDLNYFKHFFETDYYKRTIKSLAEGANINNLKTEHFDNLNIPLPPLEEQKKIAAILDAADDYRQKTKALINKYDQLTQSLFLDMFGDPVTNPKGWDYKNLSELVSKLGDGIHGTPNYSEDGEYYFINGNNLHQGQIFIDDKTKRVSKAEFLKHRKELNSNTVLVSINGTIGKVAFYNNEPIMLGKSACYFNLIEGVVNRSFLYNIFYSPYFKRYAGNQATGSTIKNVSLKTMRAFPIPYPPLKLQNQFAERVAQIEKQKLQAEASLVKAEELFSSLLQRAFKGELTN